jgi:hypothetical protein
MAHPQAQRTSLHSHVQPVKSSWKQISPALQARHSVREVHHLQTEHLLQILF